jgi:3-hydroxybutyryl-CoA dehydrogenase
MDALARILDKGAQRGFYAAEQKAATLARIRPATELGAYAACDMVIEAVFEDEQVKARTFAALDEVCKADCILASNTSSISISGLASHVKPQRRARFVGTHFFSPVSRMKLVEVIPGLDTDEPTIEHTMAVCREAGKTPIRVKDVVGFAVNRVLHAFMIEAVRLVEEGVATPEDIDLACKLGLGHPIGPFELMDATQLSLSLQVEEILQGAYGDRFRPRPLLKQMVQAGYNGKRVGRGWYRHDKK